MLDIWQISWGKKLNGKIMEVFLKAGKYPKIALFEL